jgi:hypothetical protein
MSKKVLFFYFDHDGLSLRLIQDFYKIKSLADGKIAMEDISAIDYATSGGEFPKEMTRLPAVITIDKNQRTIFCKQELIEQLFTKLLASLRGAPPR